MDDVQARDATALSALLDDELSYDATTRTRLSNHLPMALVALHRLGATDARLGAFAARYRPRLAPAPDDLALGSFDAWLAARGRRAAYGPARAYLGERIARDGLEAVLRAHLPHLVDGVSGAAFHGVIRLAYALESASDARVAAGLGYLTQVHQPLGARDREPARTDDPLAALAMVGARRELADVASDGNIGERMRAVAGHASFAGVVDWLDLRDDTPRRLTEAAVALYAATDDFTALHGVTASHALSVVAPYVEDAGALCAWWFQALAAAYATIGCPRLEDPGVAIASWLAAPYDWATIARAATASDDEHVVKLVYTARALDARAPSPWHAAIAARQAGLVASVGDGTVAGAVSDA